MNFRRPAASQGSAALPTLVALLAIGVAVDGCVDNAQAQTPPSDASVRPALPARGPTRRAPRVYEVACDEGHSERDVTNHDGPQISFHMTRDVTIWTAMVPGLRVDPRHAPHITARTCGTEVLAGNDACPRGAICTVDGGGTTLPDCFPGDTFVTNDGRVGVHCGYRVDMAWSNTPRQSAPTSDAGPTPTADASTGSVGGGLLYRRVYVTVE